MEAAASVRDRTAMWGRIGQVFADKPATAEEAIVAANLDWDVELRDLGFKSPTGSHFIKVPNQYVTVRTDTNAPLGTVKSRYVPFNNREAFAFADNLVDGAGASFESAWSMNGGKTVGLTMKLPSTVTVGGDDPFNQYLMLRTSHDGSSAVSVAIANVRMACLNQFNVTLKHAARKWSVHHSRNASTRLQQARDALSIAFAYNEEFELEMEKLIAHEITVASATTRLNATLKANRVADKPREEITAAILSDWANSATIADHDRNTAYGLLNATTEYFDHIRQYRTDDAAFKVATEGLGARVTQTIANQLLAAA